MAAILPAISHRWCGMGLLNLLQSIQPGQLAYVQVPSQLWEHAPKKRRAQVQSLLAAHGCRIAIQVGDGSLWLPQASRAEPPLISPGVQPVPCQGSRSYIERLPAATCIDGPPTDSETRLTFRACPEAGQGLGVIRRAVAVPSGHVSTSLYLHGFHQSGCLLLSLAGVQASLECSSLNTTGKCLLGLEVQVRAAFHGSAGEAHIPLRCPLAEKSAGQHFPEHHPLSFVQLLGVQAIPTLRLEPGHTAAEQPWARSVAEPCKDGRLNDVWLAACTGQDQEHTAFRLSRSAGMSFALAQLPEDIYVARGQGLTQLCLEKQVIADCGWASSGMVPLQMSASLPQPCNKAALICVEVELLVTLGSALPKQNQLRQEGCVAAALPPGAHPGPWLQSSHRIPKVSAWATL